MKILFDSQIFQMQRHGGVSRYFAELIRTIRDSGTVDSALLPPMFHQNEYVRNLGLCPYSLPLINNVFVNKISRKKIASLMIKINREVAFRQLKKEKNIIYHPTYYNNDLLLRCEKPKMVLTIFDMINELFPQYYPNNDPTTQKKRILVERAEKIIAISNNTRDDLIKIFGVKPEKIEVTYLASSLEGLKPKVLPGIEGDYILFVGHRDRYKNFSVLLECLPDLFRKYDRLKLICAGGGGWEAVESNFITQNKLTNKIDLVSCNDHELKWLFQNAKLFVYPSLYEGFGIPVLEAMASGCPVVSSPEGSLPEVGGDAVKYFDPYSKKELLNSLFKILDDNEVSEQLIKKGEERAQRFSWEKMCCETSKVYEAVQ